MRGDERVRHCGRCDRLVYNVAALRPVEVARLIERHERLPCLRLFRRPDGTIVTRHCLAFLVERTRWVWWRTTAFIGAVLAFWGTIFATRAYLPRGLEVPETSRTSPPTPPPPIFSRPPLEVTGGVPPLPDDYVEPDALKSDEAAARIVRTALASFSQGEGGSATVGLMLTVAANGRLIKLELAGDRLPRALEKRIRRTLRRTSFPRRGYVYAVDVMVQVHLR